MRTLQPILRTRLKIRKALPDRANIIRLLDSTEPDIRFVVPIEADVGQSEAESNIILDRHNKSNVRRGSVQQILYYAEITKG